MQTISTTAPLAEVRGLACVIVTYNPDPLTFGDVLRQASAQVGQVIVVDNGSVADMVPSDAAAAGWLRQLSEGCGGLFVSFPENRGLAAAQNEGIDCARCAGAWGVVLLDQDTILPDGAVAHLAAVHDRLAADGVQVGSIGCAYRDTHGDAEGAVWRARGLRIVRQAQGQAVAAGLVEADFVIASGSLLPLAVIGDVGGMETGLFIDLVDLEWGFRAASRGYRHFQTRGCVMTHTLGAGRIRLGPRRIALHAPVRNYYWLRNALVLARRSYVAPAWRLHFLLRVVPYVVVFGLGADRPRTRLGMMFRGVVDGLTGRRGAYRA